MIEDQADLMEQIAELRLRADACYIPAIRSKAKSLTAWLIGFSAVISGTSLMIFVVGYDVIWIVPGIMGAVYAVALVWLNDHVISRETPQ